MRIRFSPLLATGTRTMVPTLALFSIFLLVVGHDLPGGGFAGGLIAASALLLMFLAYGSRGLRVALPVDTMQLMGAGLGAAILAGLIGLVAEGTFLSYTYATFELGPLGAVKLSSILLFDLGVYALVIGVVATAIERLGADA